MSAFDPLRTLQGYRLKSAAGHLALQYLTCAPLAVCKRSWCSTLPSPPLERFHFKPLARPEVEFALAGPGI
jgi:hypothetical protein